MGQISLEGSLTGGPSTVSDSTFPASQFLVALGFAQGKNKQFGVASGVLSRAVASPSSFGALSGVGASDAVTKGTSLYFKCQSNMLLQVTTDDGAGNPVVAVIPVAGVLVLETPDAQFIKSLAVKGSGNVEYLVTGPV